MQVKQIKVGKMYETKQGTGICKRISTVTDTKVMIDIFFPFPRGTVWLSPRDITNEVKE